MKKKIGIVLFTIISFIIVCIAAYVLIVGVYATPDHLETDSSFEVENIVVE